MHASYPYTVNVLKSNSSRLWCLPAWSQRNVGNSKCLWEEQSRDFRLSWQPSRTKPVFLSWFFQWNLVLLQYKLWVHVCDSIFYLPQDAQRVGFWNSHPEEIRSRPRRAVNISLVKVCMSKGLHWFSYRGPLISKDQNSTLGPMLCLSKWHPLVIPAPRKWNRRIVSSEASLGSSSKAPLRSSWHGSYRTGTWELSRRYDQAPECPWIHTFSKRNFGIQACYFTIHSAKVCFLGSVMNNLRFAANVYTQPCLSSGTR